MEQALKALLLKRTEGNEEEINYIAEPLSRCCVDCACDEAQAELHKEFESRLKQSGGHADVLALLVSHDEGVLHDPAH